MLADSFLCWRPETWTAAALARCREAATLVGSLYEPRIELPTAWFVVRSFAPKVLLLINSYRGARCRLTPTLHDSVSLNYARVPHGMLRLDIWKVCQTVLIGIRANSRRQL